MPKAKSKPRAGSKINKSSVKSSGSKTATQTINPINTYDTPRNLAFGGFISLILAYIIGSRALNTGSYWEYLFAIFFLIVAIRLFIRSLRIK